MKGLAIGETNERTTRHMNATDGYLIVDRRNGVMQSRFVYATKEEAQQKIATRLLSIGLWNLVGDEGYVYNLQVIRASDYSPTLTGADGKQHDCD